MVYRNCIKLLQELSHLEEEIKQLKEVLRDLDIEYDEDELFLKIFNSVK